MKKIYNHSLWLALALSLTGCVVDQYGNVVPAGYAVGPGYYGGPGYYNGIYGPYGEPYFIYGNTYYYRYADRYGYYNHGRLTYVPRLPSGGYYYHRGGPTAHHYSSTFRNYR